MNKKIYINLVILFSLFHLGCDKSEGWDCFKKAGETITETRSPGYFIDVNAEGKINIEYRYASETYVKVTYGKNIIADIETKVDGNKLFISNETKCNWTRDMSKTAKVVIYAPTLRVFENHLSGDITFMDTLYCDTFDYDHWNANGEVDMTFHAETVKITAHTGYANIKAKGGCTNAEIYSGAVCILDAHDLKSTSLSINNSSTYDIQCYTSGYLYAAIYSSGSILYGGNPNQIDIEVQGTGEVIPN